MLSLINHRLKKIRLLVKVSELSNTVRSFRGGRLEAGLVPRLEMMADKSAV